MSISTLTNHCYNADMQLSDRVEFLITLAHQAKSTMRNAFATQNVTWKGDNSPVTEADIAINQMVIDAVKERYPGHGVWGEEQSYNPDATSRWLVDPIDGTMPFVIGAPLSTFTAAYVEEDEVLSGVIYDPFMDRLYVAEKGKGAYCNKRPISVSAKTTSNNMFFYMGSRVGTPERTLGNIIDACVNEGIRTHSFNSGAYGIARVAAGGSDAALTTADPYGISAADLILREAGGVSATFAGVPWSVRQTNKVGYIGASSSGVLELALKMVGYENTGD